MISKDSDSIATAFRIKLKARSKDIYNRTPYENNENYELGRIEYCHNMLDNNITVVTTYGTSNRKYTYICGSDESCIELINHVSIQIDHKYRDNKINTVIDKLLF